MFGLERVFRQIREKRDKRRREQEEAKRKWEEEYNAELLNPQFHEIERGFGRPISKSLRALYENKEEIVRSYVHRIVPGAEEIGIACYNPLDSTCAGNGWKPDGVHFAFASDGSGNEWVVDPTNDEAEIMFMQHETCELIPTGVKMCDFLTLREAPEEDNEN